MTPTRILHELAADFDAPLTAVDLKAVRHAFAELVESSIALLNRAQLDLDDIILEHAAALRDSADGCATVVVLPTLVDAAHWLRAYDECRRIGRNQGPCRPETIRITRLILRVRRELDSPLPDFRVADGF